MALILGEDRGQESYPLGCVSRGGDRARRLRIEDGDGVHRGAAPGTPAGLCSGPAAGTVCGAGSGPEAVCFEEEAGPPRAAPRNEENDHHNDDGAGSVNRRLIV